jgi:hypothetical protein
MVIELRTLMLVQHAILYKLALRYSDEYWIV